MRFPFDFSKLSFLGILGIFGFPKKLGFSWDFLGNFLGCPKKRGIFLRFSWDFFGTPENLGFFGDFFGIGHVYWNIVMCSMFLCTGSEYFYFVL